MGVDFGVIFGFEIPGTEENRQGDFTARRSSPVRVLGRLFSVILSYAVAEPRLCSLAGSVLSLSGEEPVSCDFALRPSPMDAGLRSSPLG